MWNFVSSYFVTNLEEWLEVLHHRPLICKNVCLLTHFSKSQQVKGEMHRLVSRPETINVATVTVISICNEGLSEGTSHISLVHFLWTVVWKDRRFPSPRGNSPHGSLLQRGCDVPSFNIPWLYNKTWVTSNWTLCPCSPSAHLSPLILEFLENLRCTLRRTDELRVRWSQWTSE